MNRKRKFFFCSCAREHVSESWRRGWACGVAAIFAAELSKPAVIRCSHAEVAHADRLGVLLAAPIRAKSSDLAIQSVLEASWALADRSVHLATSV